MAFLQQVPEGFVPACDVLNEFPVLYVEQLTTEVVRYLRYNAGVVSAKKYHDALRAEGVDIAVDECQHAINAMIYLMTGVIKARLKPNKFGQALLMFTGLIKSVITVIVKVWAEQAEVLLTDATAKEIHVGELLSLDWKVGVSVASSTCSSLNTPFVTLLVRVADADGVITSRACELSIAQFMDVAQNFEDIAELMKTA
ncbi:COMM domain-containing protein 6 [Thecamonas trahens ATCC 50062]|uniref:COMM domain-containing protein 6 n=1 Tax=Thecamonas trahens ATCC 50062 TaxID=461836 RepID=A0A0L0D437_THETB|nr:COMM domain-containing protein 6 [Thecamonas trahens ATCC 50062]KNC47112.1 COMM domain-containing protein 6 [Thecamonas trahens ATCC 50062]|eukprot:XP_013759889.1 COMM domain-containing protein 6 [Thecamonas trahens ATCC 50062]